MNKDTKSNGKQIKQLKTKNYELKNDVELLKEKSKAQEIQLDTFKKTVAGQEKLCIAMNEYLGKTSKQWIGMVKEFHIMKKVVDQMMTEGILEGRLAPTLDGQLAMVKFDYLDEKGIVQMRPEFNKKIKAFQPVKEIVPKKKSTKKKSTKKKSTLGKQMGLVSLDEKKKAADYIKAHPKTSKQKIYIGDLRDDPPKRYIENKEGKTVEIGEKKNDPKANI